MSETLVPVDSTSYKENSPSIKQELDFSATVKMKIAEFGSIKIEKDLGLNTPNTTLVKIEEVPKSEDNKKQQCLKDFVIKQEEVDINCKEENSSSENFLKGNQEQPQQINELSNTSSRDRDSMNRKLYQCFKCGFQNYCKDVLSLHINSHVRRLAQPGNSEVYQCDVCHYKTQKKASLRKHLVRQTNLNDRIMDESSKDRYSVNDKLYQCFKCGFQNHCKKILKLHINFHVRRLIQPGDSEIYECNVCHYQTPNKGDLRKHLVRQTNLRNNIMSESSKNDKLYQCFKCGFQNRSEKVLRLHVNSHVRRLTQPGNSKIYQCNICHYQTRKREYLRLHLVRQTNLKDNNVIYECHICRYRSKKKPSFKSHMLSHKKKEDNMQLRHLVSSGKVPMYKCIHCTYETPTKSDIKNHLLQRKSLLGPCVPETIDSQLNLNLHNFSKDVDMYKCNECGFQTEFKEKNIMTHLVFHKYNL